MQHKFKSLASDTQFFSVGDSTYYFVNGLFTTEDKAVAESLRKSPFAEECTPEKPPNLPQKGRAGQDDTGDTEKVQ